MRLNVFDSKAYLEISKIEKEIEVKISDFRNLEDKHKAEILRSVYIEQLKLVNRCKNILGVYMELIQIECNNCYIYFRVAKENGLYKCSKCGYEVDVVILD